MNPTQEQLNARIQDSGQTPVNSPPVNTTMDASALGGSPLNFPQTPVTPDYASTISSLPQVMGLEAPTQAVTSAEKTQQGISDKLLSA